MRTENLWNDTTGGDRSTRWGGGCPSATVFTTNPTRTRASAHLRGVRKPCKACQDGCKSREYSKPASFENEELPTPRPLRPVKAHLIRVTLINSRYVDRAF